MHMLAVFERCRMQQQISLWRVSGLTKQRNGLFLQQGRAIRYVFAEGYHRAIVATRSSAIAERPPNASSLSLASFNSTLPRAQAFIIIYFGLGFTAVRTVKLWSVLFGVVVDVCCDKQDSLMRGSIRDKRTCMSTLSAKLLYGRNCWPHSTSHRSENHADIGRESRFCLSYLHSTTSLGGGGLHVRILS